MIKLCFFPQIIQGRLTGGGWRETGVLKTLGANKDAALPLKLFEVGDVILLAPESETGSRNERRLVALYCGKESGFEVVHGLLNLLMQVLGVPLLSAPPPPGSFLGWVAVGWTLVHHNCSTAVVGSFACHARVKCWISSLRGLTNPHWFPSQHPGARHCQHWFEDLTSVSQTFQS